MSMFNKNKDSNNTAEQFTEEITLYLLQGETIENIFPLVISYFCITNKRFIFVENEINLKEPKKMIYTIPFSSVNEVGIVYNQGLKLMGKNEVNLICRGRTHIIEFFKNVDITSIYNLIVGKIL